jgi:hypothetical protein
MFMAVRRLFALACAVAAFVPAAAEAGAPVMVKILVIEGSRVAEKIDPPLVRLVKAMPGYTGARLVDALEAKVALGSSVSLEIKGRKETLKVTVMKAEAQEVRLQLAIDALKFSTKTHHKLRSNKDATVLVRATKTGKGTALFLAVTPRL